MQDRPQTPAGRPDLALFDFDGTLTTRETFPDFLRHAVPPRRLAVGRVLLAPLVVAYRIGLVPVATLRAWLVRYGFAGVAKAALDDAGARFARDVLPGVLRPDAMTRLRWH
ncbi:haloacid dehalogenase-like hydrolase [Luteimonas sp. BDR2-5]|uniref:haloacid dehalogenase-like hydrolase n=1 Tax=Proluteimonas luteida TaxID=2878685 RepID=UPI001E417012|nr:haloacid dehalogenase-like hydrolase [Luteimonas sp. BDR2-5]MCD9028054.1 haloacid dehalogenase-like hydrolase [Luteimonas sp. BDR2-5]